MYASLVLIILQEPGNLYNKHSYKYSGLANRANTIDIGAHDRAIVLAKSSRKQVSDVLRYMP